MAAPKFAPADVTEQPRAYASPDHVPAPWAADRPAEVDGFQPQGGRLGYQGPDQGFALRIAKGFRDRLHVAAGERIDDVIRGGLGIALRRASMFSRAPSVHDLIVAFTIWGFLHADPPAELVALRGELFSGLANVAHSYDDVRQLVDMTPEATLRMTPAQVGAAFPQRWRELTGADATG